MNDDYLWDKSGEPDPHIQELEEILAPLRYQRRALVLPLVRRRNYLPLAIAATLLIALSGGGLWMHLRKQNLDQPQQATSASPAPSAPSLLNEPEVAKNTEVPKKPVRKRQKSFNQRDRQEALAAKQQVMLALRLASEKLKLAQRRTQTPSPNQIKNQHRLGERS